MKWLLLHLPIPPSHPTHPSPHPLTHPPIPDPSTRPLAHSPTRPPIPPVHPPITSPQRPKPSPPQVIFLDAVCTLFGVAGSVGQIYSEIARGNTEVRADAEELNQAFFRTFKAAPPIGPFLTPIRGQIPILEFTWWRGLGQQTFSSAGGLDQFVDFDSFFYRPSMLILRRLSPGLCIPSAGNAAAVAAVGVWS